MISNYLKIGLISLALAVLGNKSFSYEKKGTSTFSFFTVSSAKAATGEKIKKANVPVKLEEKTIGADNAPLKIIEYVSMSCGACALFHEEIFPNLKKKYIDTGKIQFIFREFPLDPSSTAAFMLARCGKNERYFDMINILFHRQSEWTQAENTSEILFSIVKQTGFTKESFDSCLSDQKLLDGINQVRDHAAREFSVNKTPSFFINGEEFEGEFSLKSFEAAIDSALRQ
ncbi:MAG: DsbA family protein [Alphaproteobacteria bacterium]|nr:DsbA family protein [Alphaproteobacteria bacterium]